jgi:hypothetical protein
MALSVYDVVKGIWAAVHNKHEGAIDENGKPVEIGLKREDQPITDKKVMDGFGISMHGNILLVRYHSVEPIQDLHQKKFEKQVESRINEIVAYIKKEFDKHTGSSLRLKEAGEVSVLVETGNRIKVMVKAQRPYEVLNLKDSVNLVGNKSSTEKIEAIAAANKKLVKGALKPRNVTRKDK